jgi:hypothetical protein
LDSNREKSVEVTNDFKNKNEFPKNKIFGTQSLGFYILFHILWIYFTYFYLKILNPKVLDHLVI